MDRETVEPHVECLPGARAQRWVDFHHTYAAPSTYVYEFVWDITADAIGPFCTDVDGNVLMDFTSHVGASPLGYNHPALVEALAEVAPVSPGKIAGQDFYVSTGWPPDDTKLPGPTQLMEHLVDITNHYNMDMVFLSNSGAEAIENAAKICYQDGSHRAITFEGAFHGRTLGALSLNRSKAIHRKGFPAVPGVISVPYCTCQDECRCGWRTAGPAGNVLADRLHPDQGSIDPQEIAFLILEPIQGEGGFRIPSDGFAQDIGDIQSQYGIAIISDEIQAGLGRTGELWAIDHTPIEPDVIASAKALRVGATVARSDRFPESPGRLSSTWGAGDILAALEGAETIDVIRREGLLENARDRGRRFRKRLAAEIPEPVIDVRGRGLMLAVEFHSNTDRDAVVDAAFERGLLVLGCGYRSVRLLPPLDVTEREIDMGVDLLLAAIEDALSG